MAKKKATNVISSKNEEIEKLNKIDVAELKPIRTKRRNHEVEEKEEEAVLSPASRMFHEPNYNIHIIGIMGWKGESRVDVIKDNIVNSMLKHPRFSSLQVKDEKDEAKIKWVPIKVNVDDHIVMPTLDQNMKSPDEFVENYISNLSKTPLDQSKPLWDLHILILKTSDSDAVSIFRIHHSLGDGVSLVSQLLSSTRKTSDPNSLPTFPTSKKKKSEDVSLNNYFWKIWLVIRMLMNTIIDVLMFGATAMFLKDTDMGIVVTSLDEGVPRHRFIRRTVDLDDVKLVKNATNATINDVVLGVSQAGLSRYLSRRYGEIGNQTKNDQHATNKKSMMPKDIRFRATVLINLRALMEFNGSPETKKNTIIENGNCFGFVLLPFKIAMVDNPIDHVRYAKAIMDRKKQSYEVLFTSYILQIVLKFFGYKGATALAKRVPSQTSLAFSNVMGPSEEISYCGHPMTYVTATCYGQPTGLMIHVVSYTNKLTFAISVDERTIPDPYQLGDDIVESLELMKKAIFDKDIPMDN